MAHIKNIYICIYSSDHCYTVFCIFNLYLAINIIIKMPLRIARPLPLQSPPVWCAEKRTKINRIVGRVRFQRFLVHEQKKEKRITHESKYICICTVPKEVSTVQHFPPLLLFPSRISCLYTSVYIHKKHRQLSVCVQFQFQFPVAYGKVEK